MNNNNQEIEIKLKLSDPEVVFKNALELGGKELKEKEGLEHDVMYDDGKGFFDAFKVLRIRTAPFGNLLTYKEKNEHSDQDNFLVRTEIETFIEDPKAMDQILRKLGYVPHVEKDKYVKKIEIDGLVIEFHKLPFIGDFIEIEGERELVSSLVRKIGLDPNQGIGIDYSSLFENYCKEHGWDFHKVPHTFDEENKHLQKS
ncbi:MAG TPA: class IV adenylate cyclase [Verrucomicrobiae bacterium]|nr:class IV adenylate cyclase [Verrucomicrobiae bacterium]